MMNKQAYERTVGLVLSKKADWIDSVSNALTGRNKPNAGRKEYKVNFLGTPLEKPFVQYGNDSLFNIIPRTLDVTENRYYPPSQEVQQMHNASRIRHGNVPIDYTNIKQQKDLVDRRKGVAQYYPQYGMWQKAYNRHNKPMNNTFVNVNTSLASSKTTNPVPVY